LTKNLFDSDAESEQSPLAFDTPGAPEEEKEAEWKEEPTEDLN
jgi:hypothetical protein